MRPATLLIHIALATIVAGALLTHFLGVQGEVTLREGAPACRNFTKTSGPGDATFPFAVALKSAEIDFYPATTTPMDFRSLLLIDGRPVEVAMNRVARMGGWRFCQTGIAPGSSTLTVSHDPAGRAVTFAGYLLLGAGMIAFFFQRRTLWRSFLRRWRRGTAAAIIAAAAFTPAFAADANLPAMQRPLAANLGKAFVYWNDRVAPLQTMALDVTRTLYGSASYRGLSAEQVLSGWLFYFDRWERDFNENHPGEARGERARKKLTEQRALIAWLGTGGAFRIYPYRTAGGFTEWMSLTGRRPSQMSLEQWKFMLTAMPEIKALLLEGRNIAANEAVGRLIEGQRRYAGAESLPSNSRVAAERLYNRIASIPLVAVIAAAAGIFCLASRRSRPVTVAAATGALYLALLEGLLWFTGGHIPLSNGPETMMFMGLAAMTAAVFISDRIMRASLLLIAAVAQAVAAMGGTTPRIGALMPVLASPLLSVHVMLVMIAYLLFLLMAALACGGLMTRDPQRRLRLYLTNRVILVPAVFLLAAGIFVGAVWADCSWGRYWGWDPKETCALVMLLVYAVPLHRSVRPLLRERSFQAYILAASATVVFTYFGANYLLKGLHSYA